MSEYFSRAAVVTLIVVTVAFLLLFKRCWVLSANIFKRLSGQPITEEEKRYDVRTQWRVAIALGVVFVATTIVNLVE